MSNVSSEPAIQLLNPKDNRESRYLRTLEILPSIVAKGYPIERVIKILNRVGVIQDENLLNPQVKTKRGQYRQEGDEIILPQTIDALAIAGGQEIESVMSSFSLAIDTLLSTDTDPYELAAWSYLQLGAIHPFVEGTGRVQRLLANYILVHQSRPTYNFPLVDGHIDAFSRINFVMDEYNSLIDDEMERSSLHPTRAEILERLNQRATSEYGVSSSLVGELAQILRARS